jgi:signal transduction histidine kinase
MFLLAGILALAGMALPDSKPNPLSVIAISDFVVATAAWFGPWHRLHPRATVALAIAGLIVLGFSTWAFGGVATGTGPFFVLLFAWVGLHHPPVTAFLLAPLTATAYIVPLVVTDQPAAVTGSAVVFVPVTTAVAVLIAQRVRQLHLARESIEVAERWRAALMVTLAHDVRTPLTTVQGVLEVLRDDPDLEVDDRHQLIGSALRQTARITRLASGLLDVGRVEEGALKLNLRAVPVRSAAEHAVQLAPYCNAHIDVDNGVAVHADPDRLEQILINIISNATRHGAPPITITAYRSNGHTAIAIRDHGSGVPEHARPTLFARFAAASEAPQSAGLGLWIVRELARAHGGDVRYEPAHPGARFVVTLPSADATVPR